MDLIVRGLNSILQNFNALWLYLSVCLSVFWCYMHLPDGTVSFNGFEICKIEFNCASVDAQTSGRIKCSLSHFRIQISFWHVHSHSRRLLKARKNSKTLASNMIHIWGMMKNYECPLWARVRIADEEFFNISSSDEKEAMEKARGKSERKSQRKIKSRMKEIFSAATAACFAPVSMSMFGFIANFFASDIFAENFKWNISQIKMHFRTIKIAPFLIKNFFIWCSTLMVWFTFDSQ